MRPAHSKSMIVNPRHERFVERTNLDPLIRSKQDRHFGKMRLNLDSKFIDIELDRSLSEVWD